MLINPAAKRAWTNTAIPSIMFLETGSVSRDMVFKAQHASRKANTRFAYTSKVNYEIMAFIGRVGEMVSALK